MKPCIGNRRYWYVPKAILPSTGFRKTCGPWRQCPAYRQSDPCQRQDAFLYLRASFREPSALSGAVEHPENLRELGSRARRGSYDEREGVRSRMSRLRDRATALEIQINAELLMGHMS